MMKHIIILGDGMADWPVKSLGGKTLLQAAKTPYMDKLARMGRVGRLKTVADGFHPGSEVANMSVLGYNLPKAWMNKAHLNSVRVFGSVDNLAIFSHLKGMDPQYNFAGETNYSYSPNKTFSFGVEVNF